MEFETAAKYRDLLNSVKSVAQKQKITSHEFGDRDVIAYSQDGTDAVVQVFFIRQGKRLQEELKVHISPQSVLFRSTISNISPV